MTTPHKPITDWHRQRAAELMNTYAGDNLWRPEDFAPNPKTLTREVFLQYIADHEDPPVDPDLLAAREIVAKARESRGDGAAHADAALTRAGRRDHTTSVSFTLAGIKYGREHP